MGKRKSLSFRLMKVLFAALALTMLLGMGALADEFAMDSSGYYMYRGTQQGVYVHFYLPSDGLLQITGQAHSSYSSTNSVFVTLCDANMQDIAYSTYVNANNKKNAIYGVKKGSYYVKVNSYSGSQYILAYQLIYSVNDQSGARKSKAKTLKKGATAYGVLAAGEASNKEDWYKFKVTKNKYLWFTVDSLISSTAYVYLYGPSLPKYGSSTYVNSSQTTQKCFVVRKPSNKKVKVKPGTYYLKVVRGASGTNGIYSLKWGLK